MAVVILVDVTVFLLTDFFPQKPRCRRITLRFQEEKSDTERDLGVMKLSVYKHK